jgi:hypothetical protein
MFGCMKNKLYLCTRKLKNTTNMATFRIDISGRPLEIKLFSLTDEQIEQSSEFETLSDFYDYLLEEDENIEPVYENIHLIDTSKYFELYVKDEEGNQIYAIDGVDEYMELQKTYIDDDEDIEFEFEGVPDGNYLVVSTVLKGVSGHVDIELDEFDPNKLYLLPSQYINDELTGSDTFDFFELYYQQGEGYDKQRDRLDVNDDSVFSEYSSEYLMMSLTDKECWSEL